MIQKKETCCQCGRRLTVGMHLLERFYPDEKTMLIFHRSPCYEQFMGKLEARRKEIFEKEYRRLKYVREKNLPNWRADCSRSLELK